MHSDLDEPQTPYEYLIRSTYFILAIPDWKKFIAGLNKKDNLSNNLIEDFIAGKNQHLVIMKQGSDSSCEISISATYKDMNIPDGKKALLVIRKHDEGEITVQNIQKEVIYQEITSDVIGSLAVIVSSHNALLTRDRGIGGILYEDIKAKLHKFLGEVSTVHGFTKRKTILPLPPRDLLINLSVSMDKDSMDTESSSAIPLILHSNVTKGGMNVGKEQIHILENILSVWTRLIRHVLDKQPETNLCSGTPHPSVKTDADIDQQGGASRLGPMEEINFWRLKKENLESIHEQLELPDAQMTLRILRARKSSFVQAFTEVINRVSSAREEASDITRFLRTLEPHVNKFEKSTDLVEASNVLLPMIHTLLLISKNSGFYNTPSRFSVVIRQICNSLIDKSIEFCNSEKIFNLIAEEEAPEAIQKLKTVIGICEKVFAIYDKMLERAESTSHIPNILRSTSMEYIECWKIKKHILFSNLTCFITRCQDVLLFVRTILDFSRLDKLEIGGTKGRHLTSMIEEIAKEFRSVVEDLKQSMRYEMLDPGRTKFDHDFYIFRMSVKDLDRRIACVLSSSFRDLGYMAARVKLCDSFDILLLRPIILEEFKKCYMGMLEEFRTENIQVMSEYTNHRTSVCIGSDDAPIYPNVPPIAGAIFWARSLRARIENLIPPIIKYTHFYEGKYIHETSYSVSPESDDLDNFLIEESKRSEKPDLFFSVLKECRGTLNILKEFQTQMYDLWEVESIDEAKSKLEVCLLARHDRSGKKILQLNFNHCVTRLLKEVRYFLLFGMNVHNDALDIYSRADTYRQWTGRLEVVVKKYNTIVGDLLPVEAPLFADRIVRMDDTLSAGLTELRWHHQDRIPQFVNKAEEVVNSVSAVLDQMKSNLRKISKIMSKWSSGPLLERKNKPVSIEDFDANHKSLLATRRHQISEDGKEIHQLVKDSLDALKIPKTHPHWVSYINFMNIFVIEGLVSAVSISLQYACELLDPAVIQKQDSPPLFDVKMHIVSSELIFDPGFVFSGGANSQLSLKGLINSWINDFFSICSCFPRIDTGTGDYLNELRHHFDIQSLLSLLTSLVNNTYKKCNEFHSLMMEYSFLFLSSFEDSFKEFLKDGARELVTDFQEEEGVSYVELMKIIGVNVGCPLPPMLKFSGVLTSAAEMTSAISALKSPIDIHWLRINLQPMKTQLKLYVSQWENHYTRFLTDFLEARVQSLDTFIEKINSGLNEEMCDDSDSVDDTLLYTQMTHLRDVKLATNAIKLLFNPLKEITLTLKRHGVPVQDEILASLERSPEKWDQIVRVAFDVKEKIIPLQSAEMLKMRKRIDAFGITVKEFRQRFLSECPFDVHLESSDVSSKRGSGSASKSKGSKESSPTKSRSQKNDITPDNSNTQHPAIETEKSDSTMDGFSCSTCFSASYQLIDEYLEATNRLIEEGKSFNNLELLFDMVMSVYTPLNHCTSDLIHLKNLWDFISLVDCTFKAWNKTTWKYIDADYFLVRTKDFSNQMKYLPKEVRGWKAFIHVQSLVKNLATVLPLINDLSQDTMKERHWRKIMDVTGKVFVKDDNFCLQDILELQLYKYAEDISEIVDQSSKETKVEGKLSLIETEWNSRTLSFARESADSCPLIADLSELIEVLEGHLLELMGMTSQGRFIEFCQAVVDKWSTNLRTVESVLGIWQKVQRSWCRLEPIFMLSEDIRSQLPDDSKKFESLDTEWRQFMVDASQMSNAVEICCTEGRVDVLERLYTGIETCERSLNNYLEQKKKAFPRFYFASNQALLDVLSNGNKPLKVSEYIGDFFDGIQRLDFEKAPQTGTIASGVYSKDTEYVPFSSDMILEGAVETYLSSLESHIKFTLRDILESAKNSSDNWDVEKPREIWLQDYCTQLSLVATQIVWTEEVGRCFEELEAGSETAMKDYKKVCDERIEKLIKQVQLPLSADLRAKIITLITIDVHARDVVEKFVQEKVTDPSSFHWQSQLKFYWNNISQIPNGSDLVLCTPPELKTCCIKICDWTTLYQYEYVGNCGRLVITPLTDRCYITLTQALNLIMGGAPAGPAGTGKTETTKDLARAIGLPIVVFNCSDQMSYLTMAQIFMGLAQSGAWGCFDEFNRISIEVLSVISTQVKTILDAIRMNTPRFTFMDEEIRLVKTCGFFITMNPGYAGRTELPENLKALFRSCAMVVPDLVFICENMLMSEGFVSARSLARKFVSLYSLCKELLSKQMHYDWGLRAVKSLLRQAGSLKRSDPDADEYRILMKALRDFNTPKIVTSDIPIFLRLIEDLFPGINEPTELNVDFSNVVAQVAKRRGLQPDEAFLTKVVGLIDLLHVRHCCFIIGPSGSAKTETWKCLIEALNEQTPKSAVYEALNPKAMTSDELYGIMTKTSEWKDGAIAVIMRNMSKEINGYKLSHQWKIVVLDGDIDATWIESMNTVMDDNKVLTLVSNERIPFTPSMRMILEIQDMKCASPATVSRGGVLYINETDIGWKPYVESWRTKFDNVSQSTLYLLFTNYFENNIDYIRRNFVFCCPMLDMSFIQSICCLMDSLMDFEDNQKVLNSSSHDEQKVIFEGWFIFSFMWTIGGALSDDKIVDHKRNFGIWFRGSVKGSLKFPDRGDPMDYHFDAKTQSWIHWESSVLLYTPRDSGIFKDTVVSNIGLERMKYVLSLCQKRAKAVLFCGAAGTGKTVIVRDYLSELTEMLSCSINLNSYSDSYSLQIIIESVLDKRTGRRFGPPGNKKCVYFIDDLNMPTVDTYDTQSAIMLLTQIISYGTIYDRNHLEEKKEIADVQFVACMNPSAGSFMINARLQRHFTVLCVPQPTVDAINSIYTPILSEHLKKFPSIVNSLTESIVSASSDLLQRINQTAIFLPSASKFHYQFNLKEIDNIFQSLLVSRPGIYTENPSSSTKFIGLWYHECQRVFADKMISIEDNTSMIELIQSVAKKHFSSDLSSVFTDFENFTSFVSIHGGNEKIYMAAKDAGQLKNALEAKLAEYNETYAVMNLVLFSDAMNHVCRISRIIDSPCGHALLVGVGGSGKQSVARLACHIMQTDVYTIVVNEGYGQESLKVDIQEMYKKAAVKPGAQIAFLLTDGQIADERFLVYINDILATGNIPDLFTREEYDEILGQIRNQAKAAGVADETGALLQFFIEKVRRNLHVILCHSPVADTFRVRGRKFPALISATTIDVFHPWPRDALTDVSTKFLASVKVDDPATLPSIGKTMAEIHVSIDTVNREYLRTKGRHNYTTPKSFLELIDFYTSLYEKKRLEVDVSIERLEKGLTIIQHVKEKVAGLKTDLEIKMKQVEEKKVAADILITEVTKASDAASIEKATAVEEATKTNIIAENATKIKSLSDIELAEALPAMEAAKEAVNCLTKSAITELKSLTKPPPDCVEVTKSVLILLKNEKKNLDWKSAQKMMNNPQAFLDEVGAFNANEIEQWVLDMVENVTKQPFYNYETMKSKSVAAAYLANWVLNIIKYHKIYKKVAPLMLKVAEATKEKDEAEAALAIVMEHVRKVEEKVAGLQKTLDSAVQEKEQAEAEAEHCQASVLVAERLINGLSGEFVRWTSTVKRLRNREANIGGDALIASAFVGYVSPFSASFRKRLWAHDWPNFLKNNSVSFTEGSDPLSFLSSEAAIAEWKNEGLPADRISIENAAVVTSCKRWPLLIDPQLQGLKWIKQRFKEDLTVVHLTKPNWLNHVLQAVSMGQTLLIESVGEDIDALLEPLLSRSIIRRGRSSVIKLGGKEVDFDENFRLIMQTKLSNPHYRPELSAQCTIINFIVTPEGLGDQILALVVNMEKPELEQQKQELVRQQNIFQVTLARLEDELLAKLSAADPETILENISLIEGLEDTKNTSNEIEVQISIANKTEEEINISRQEYREVSEEGSMFFFLIIQLCHIEHMYQYSLDSFITFLSRAIESAPMFEDVKERCDALVTSVRMRIFRWVNRGLFENHKLIFCALLTFKLLSRGKLPSEFNQEHYSFLLRGPVASNVVNPLSEWLPDHNWLAIQKLVELSGFESFAQNMERDAPSRFKDWFNEFSPESHKLPLDWKKLDEKMLEKMLVIRCLRPDRITSMMSDWIRTVLPDGRSYLECDSSSSFYDILSDAYEESSNTCPIFFILSPGADPVKEVEAFGRKKIQLQINENYFNVAMGQGQDAIAMSRLELGHKQGYWIMLQNIHLMPRWCIDLEKKLDQFAASGSHPNFRCFFSADPCDNIPIGILERSIKLTNEPPQGLLANLRRAFASFGKEEFEEKDSKVKSILFGLCHFHAIMIERKKFGPLGFNMLYPFSPGDLRDSATVLYNYLENASTFKLPWEDLRYIFGEIMYGGHIVDDWDRKLCKTYLEWFIQADLLDETELVPYIQDSTQLSFMSPTPGSHERFAQHIQSMPQESPLFFGLHPNAEIGFRTSQCNYLLKTLHSLEAKSSGEGEQASSKSPVTISEETCQLILSELKDTRFDVSDIPEGEEKNGPYRTVFVQECVYMNELIAEISRSLEELQLGLKGELTMSEGMEYLSECLFLEKIPGRWLKLSFPTTRGLTSWVANIKERCEQLESWINDPTVIPKVVDISKLFNPQSFLTAVKQVCCQQQGLELDKLVVSTEVLKKRASQIEGPSKDGAYITGLYLEGARWDINTNSLEESRPKETFSMMPVINCRAIMETDIKDKGFYICPTYCTPARRPNFVFSAQLRTKYNPNKWVLAGVAMILDIGT